MTGFDGKPSQTGERPEVRNLAAKLGLPPPMVEKAIATLAIAHQQPGNTAQLAAGRTGLEVATIQSIIEAVGGENALGRFAREAGLTPRSASAPEDGASSTSGT
jgi:hypothetical protein